MKDPLPMDYYYQDPDPKFSPTVVLCKKVIRSLRMREGLSVAQGAKKIGVAKKTLEDIESVAPSGKKDIGIDILAKIATAYIVDLNEFWDEDAVYREGEVQE